MFLHERLQGPLQVVLPSSAINTLLRHSEILLRGTIDLDGFYTLIWLPDNPHGFLWTLRHTNNVTSFLNFDVEREKKLEDVVDTQKPLTLQALLFTSSLVHKKVIEQFSQQVSITPSISLS